MNTHYPDVKTSPCDACLGAGCYTCRHDGHLAFCAGCGDAVDTELPDVAYDAQIEYLGTHGGFCAGCVGKLEREVARHIRRFVARRFPEASS